MGHKHFLVVFNPKSGRKRASKIAKKYISSSDELCTFIPISGGSAKETSENLREKLPYCDAIVAIGGDGLVNLVVQEIVMHPKPLFVHSAGTGNDFHRHNFSNLKFNHTSSKIQFIDLARCEIAGGQRFYGQVLSAGFDSLVNRRANRLRYLPGSLKYVLALLLELPTFKPIKYELKIDGKRRDLEAMMVVVANGPTYGGGMKVLPDAISTDGELDILILHPVSKFTLLRVFPKVFFGRHIDHPQVEIFKCKSIELISNAPIYADGEHFGDGRFFVEVIPQILPLIGSRWI